MTKPVAGVWAHDRWWRPRSLRRQLVVGVCGIVSVAMVAIGAVAEVGLRNEMVSLTNSQVANSLAAFNYSYAKARLALARPEAREAAAIELGGVTGQAPGTVIALMRNNRVVFATSFGEGEPAPAPTGAVRALEAIDWRTGGPRSVRLDEMGAYQVGSRDLGGGERLISAVSLDVANSTLSRYAWMVAILVGLVLVLAAAATVVLVRNSLRPLRRVAAIAGQVARLPLEADDYRITARVSDRDTDPESEVGVVGSTLNHMLDHVDAALTQRARSDRQMRQFITDASHELRTPLASILGYAELTRQESELLPPMTEYALERIEAESRRMSSLVSDLLLLSRLDEGQDLQIEDFDMCELVADAVNDATVTAPEHHFEADLPDHPVWVRGDRARLQQLVANLLGNARMHTPPGTTVTTALGRRMADGRPMVLLEVADDGPGIPEAIMPNLFGRFVRADKARSREMGSSGLGLAIVASVVEAHGGTVRADSRPGRTVFTVLLPGAPADGQRAPAAP